MNSNRLQMSTIWERPALPAGNGETTLMIRLIAPLSQSPSATTRSAVDLAFVIDRSGSMDGQPIELAKQAVSQAVGLLDHRDRAALVVYDDAIDVLFPLATTDSSGRARLRHTLTQVDARGSTNLCDGWLTGCRELAKHAGAHLEQERIRRAILLTDGLANAGETSLDVICHHATELRRRGISTTTLGMGQQFDERLLSGMAEAGGGNFVYLESATQLSQTFERELGRLTATIASQIELTLEFPDGLRGKLLNRFPVERKGRRFEIALDDLVPGDEVVLVFAITSHKLNAGNQMPLELTLNWTDPISGVRHHDHSPLLALDIIDAQIYSAMPGNDEVTAQAAILRAAANQHRAMELDREGRFAESRAMHNAAFDLLQSAPLETDDVHLLDEARDYAAQDVTIAFSEHDRKFATAASFQRARRRRTAGE